MDIDPHQAGMQVTYIQAECKKYSAFYLHWDGILMSENQS
jgi:hypothetical protein